MTRAACALVAVALLAGAGCRRPTPPAPEPAAPPLAERALEPGGAPTLEIGTIDWERSADGRELHVEGTVKNVGTRATRSIKVWVEGLDAGGTRIARVPAFPSPQQVAPGTAARFVVRMPNDEGIRSFHVEAIGR